MEKKPEDYVPIDSTKKSFFGTLDLSDSIKKIHYIIPMNNIQTGLELFKFASKFD